jgi:tRNA-(ms[2]io[6]A)-hydroxylase
MKLSLDLTVDSPKEWIEAVMADFDSFLQDHADCERKASAMAMSLVAKYPNRIEIIPELIETALEEMEHFQQVYQIMEARGIQLAHSIPEDKYVKQLLMSIKTDKNGRFMDRLLLGSIIECRGAERFRLVYEALPVGELKQFYHELWASEAKHGNVFVDLALKYFDKKTVYDRLNHLNEIEGEVLLSLPFRPALH